MENGVREETKVVEEYEVGIQKKVRWADMEDQQEWIKLQEEMVTVSKKNDEKMSVEQEMVEVRKEEREREQQMKWVVRREEEVEQAQQSKAEERWQQDEVPVVER